MKHPINQMLKRTLQLANQGGKIGVSIGFVWLITVLSAPNVSAVNPDSNSLTGACPPAWVQIEFTVTPSGETRDIAVVDASVDGAYQSLAKRVVSRWSLAPRAIEERMSQRVEFELYGCKPKDTTQKKSTMSTCESICA